MFLTLTISFPPGGDEHPGDGMPGGDALKRSPLGLNSRDLKQSGCSGDSNVEGERATTARRPALRTAKRALVVTTMTKHNRESQGREGRDDAAHRRSRWFEACTPPGKRRRRHTGGCDGS
ncbi:hypothetical protein Bca4012_093319 [Brassica carinata]|uniref:Uncharacterized protein n=1 Tax=Brassica carinata TaxID=52824 RepID=A0A8X7PQL2_BRACI|nr:hypothetical protein Bca52824_075535 [Brassica carinata]